MEEQYQVDKEQVRDAFSRAAAAYEQVAVLQREVETRSLERLDLVRLQPQCILDLGCGPGHGSHGLLAKYRQASVIAFDLAEPMLKLARKRGRWLRRPQAVCGDAQQLPFASNSMDLVFSSLMLQWCRDFDATLSELLRVLRPGGLLLFTTFGPDTLKELRSSWASIDDYTHVNAFLDMHDIGDALMRNGFAEPVMDVERLTMTYDDVFTLMRELKQIGAHNVTAGRRQGLTGKQRLQQLQKAYEAFRVDGLLPASYEIVNGHAWAPDNQLRVDLEMPR
ncbi:MAG: malonyl-ACP O-methyltransferase BioC [Gammaproteobacteria bacterium]